MFHRIRGGHCFTNEKERYDFEHSEEMVRPLADEGINVVMMHYYRGMGFDREKPDMENTRRFIEICHRYDILVGTFWNETFPAEHPEAMEYCQRDEFNRLAWLLGQKVENVSRTTFVAVTAGAGGDADDDPASRFGERWEYGEGRVCWIPRAVMTHPLPPGISGQLHTMIHGNSHWDVPGNWREILDGLDWALADGRWVPMDTPSTVVPQVSRPADGEHVLVHLVNYDPGKKIEGLSVRISSSLIKPVKAMWRTPEEPEPVELERNLSSTGTELALPEWVHHGTITLL